MARTKTTSNPPPVDYRALYHWAPEALLAETSKITTLEDLEAYKDSERDEDKSRIFGKEHDRFVKVMPCRKGELVCADDAMDAEDPFFFLYATVFKRIKLRLPFTGFKRALLTEVNETLAQLHPNSWAFIRAFSILCDHFGHTPSVDAFLYFFEAKSHGKRLWVSFNGVAGRVLLSLFQQSNKGFKGKFFNVRCSAFDSTLLDGFLLYWVKEPGLKKPRRLEDLNPLRSRNLQVLFHVGVGVRHRRTDKVRVLPRLPQEAYWYFPFLYLRSFCVYSYLLMCLPN